MLVLLFMTAGYVSHRHVMPLIGMMLPATAAGTIWLSERLAAYVPRLRPPKRALTAIMLVILLGLLPKSVRPLHGVYSSLVEAACWIKEHGHPGDSVLATSGYVRFYAEMKGLLLGPEAPNLPIGLVLAPEARPWSYIVLEVDERTFDRALVQSGGRLRAGAGHPRSSAPDLVQGARVLPQSDRTINESPSEKPRERIRPNKRTDGNELNCRSVPPLPLHASRVDV